MIKFFRRIRQRLLSENRMGKYLIYAIGEILLVVVGILIALSINNWNQDNKNRHREVVILQEILNSINEDLSMYEGNFERRKKRKKAGLDSLMSYVFDRRPIHDSLINEWYSELKTDIIVRYDDGPFEALKSTGLEIIRSDSLRLIINDSYSSALPALRHFSEISIEDNDAIINQREKEIMMLRPITHSDGDQHLHTYPKVDDIFTNENFLWILHAEQRKLDNFGRRTKSIIGILEKMKIAIEKELQL